MWFKKHFTATSLQLRYYQKLKGFAIYLKDGKFAAGQELSAYPQSLYFLTSAGGYLAVVHPSPSLASHSCAIVILFSSTANRTLNGASQEKFNSSTTVDNVI